MYNDILCKISIKNFVICTTNCKRIYIHFIERQLLIQHQNRRALHFIDKRKNSSVFTKYFHLCGCPNKNGLAFFAIQLLPHLGKFD